MFRRASFGIYRQIERRDGLPWLVGRYWIRVAQRTRRTEVVVVMMRMMMRMMIVLGIAPAKDMLDERLGCDIDGLGCQRHGDAVHLLCLPSLFDAIVNECHEASGHDNVCDVRHGIEDRLIGDPHEAGRHPATGALVSEDLAWRSRLGDNMGNGAVGIAVTYEVERYKAELLIDRPLPQVTMAPPVELVALVLALASPVDVDTRIVAELEFDGLGGFGLLLFALALAVAIRWAVGERYPRVAVDEGLVITIT